MNDSKPTGKQMPAEQQCEALKESEERATDTEPQNFRDRANEEKIVEVPPIDDDGVPIRGLDPDN